MIWHIFKKDWKLLWRWAVMLAAMQIGFSLTMWASFGSGKGALRILESVLVVAVMLGGVFMIAAIAHQDSVPGERQDWLIRPIRRKHLLGSKILSVLLLIHVPMLAANLLYAVLNRFPIGQALQHAATLNILLLLGASLPCLAFMSLTKNFTEVIALGFAAALGVALFESVLSAFHWQLNLVYAVTNQTGLRWVPETSGYFVGFLGALTVLAIQYFRRRVSVARVLAIVTGILFLLVTSFLPWKTAFAIDQSFASNPGLSRSVNFSFDPSVGRFRYAPRIRSEADPTLYLPVKIDGLPANTVLKADRYLTRVVFPSGESKLISIDTNADFLENGQGHLKVGLEPLNGFPPLDVSNDERVLTQPMRLEIEMSLTLFRQTGSMEPPPGSRGISASCSGFAHNMTSVYTSSENTAEAAVNLRCGPVLKPVCTTLILHDVPARYVPRLSLTCPGDYRPYAARLFHAGDVMIANAYLRDPADSLRPPVLVEHFLDTQATVNTYEPADHFTRTLVIPDVRLKDWSADVQ